MSQVAPAHHATWFSCYEPRPDAALRLFGFPHGGGGPQAFREWAKLLPDYIELYALNLPGRGSRRHEPLATAMTDLVPRVVEALPDYVDKPFIFFGHSVGALVAFAVADHLHQAQWPLPLHLFVSAHPAPQRAGTGQPMYQLADAELAALVHQLGLVPDEVWVDSALLDLILPPLRADFELSETFRWGGQRPLPIPITALGGHADTLVTEADLRAWADCTAASFDMHMFEGDHFYTQGRQGEVTALIAQAVEADVGRLEKSILCGEAAPYPQLCLHEWFRQQAARTPDAPAVVGDDVILRFRELDALTDVLARYLQHCGVGVDRLVGIYMETSVTYVIAYLAALKAGGAYMPIELAYPEALLSRVLEAAQPVVILTLDKFQQRLPSAWQPRAFSLEAGWAQRLASETLCNLNVPTHHPEPTLDALAYCVMSSGTTGTPKGILCPHRGAVNSYAWRYAYYPYEPGEREACNVFFVWEVMRPLLQGLPSYIIPDEVIYDPPRLVEFLSRHRITRVLFTPSLLEQILNTPDLDLSGKLRHLRVVYLNGEVVTTALCTRFHQRLPQVTLLNDYSISECHDVCTHDLAQRHEALSPRYTPLGPPMTNVRVYVLDEHLQPVPRGFRGEIYVGGDSLARGYLNDPERTAERFVRDPIRNDGSMLFRTGDAGRVLPNGHVEIQGRIAFMVKLRGYSIVPGAVEAAMAQHPAVQGAVVTTLDNEQTGQPEHLVAYVVGNSSVDAETLVEQLRSHLKSRLPHYAVPTFIVPLAELPIAAIGKLDRRQLPKPDASLFRASRHAGAEHPQSGLETALAAVWQEVLQIDGVEATANFFDLGGHSLLAATLCARLRQALGCDISVVDIFQFPTIRSLARSLQPQAVADRPRVTRALPSGAGTDPAIAIIGLACRFPGADTAEQFWHNLSQGVCSIRALSPEALQARGVPPEVYEQPDYIKIGANLDGIEYFDPGFWGLSRREAVLMDPQHRLFLEACWHALEHAGYAPTQGGARTGVFAGSFLPLYLLHYLRGGGLMRPDDPALAHLTEIGNDKDYLATRVSHLLNLRGPSLSVQASCATGLVAVATACQALLARQCDVALAGASSITLPQAGYTYQEGFVYSRDGQCRAFDAGASGTVLGDGVGVVVLKRLDDARASGDNILAVIKGFAVNNDGNLKADYSAPSVQGQAAVIAAAQAMAGVEADTMTYIEAHGTGTLIGDPIEVRGLTTAFRQSTDRTGFCALGSVKPNIGHSNIASGMAGLIKVILSLQHRQLPPTIHFTRPNPAMRLDETPFYVNDRLRPWEAPDGIPRRAGVTSLGIGGTNGHVILEEWGPGADPPEVRSSGRNDTEVHELLTLSAKTPNALEQNRRNLIAYLEAHAAVNLGDVAYTLNIGREVFPHRLAVTCHDIPSALAALAPLRHTGAGHDTFNKGADAAARRSVVLMFTGQGAPYLHMGRGLYDQVPTFRRYFDDCCERLTPLLQADLRVLLYQDGDDTEVLRRAYYLQPSLFAVSYALAQTLIDWGIRPTAVVGHSLGEYAAACVAGVMSLEDALSLVVIRGYAMEDADEGAMLAVNLGEAAMLAFLAEAGAPWAVDGLPVSLAAVNGPNRTVLSGRCQALADVAAALQGRGIACRRVEVARAFHSPMMQPAAEAVVRRARSITLYAPAIPLASNLTGTWLTATQAVDPAYWGEHMLQTVRFGDNIRTIVQRAPDVILEIGPGRLLTNLVAGALRHLSDHAPVLMPTMRHARASTGTDRGTLLQAVGRLWTAGVDVDWHACHRGEPHRRVALPGYAFERHRCWPDDRSPGPRPDPTRAEAPWTQDGVLPLAERFYLPSWKRALPGSNKPLEVPVPWLVWLDRGGLAGALGEALVAALRQQGHPVQRVYRAEAPESHVPIGEGAHVLRADEPQAYATLLDQLAAADLYPQRMVYLWSLNGVETSTEQALTNTYEPLLYLAQALALRAASEPLGLWVVTDQTMQVSQEPIQPIKATVLGPSLVLPQEAPHVSCRVLDVQLPAAGDLLDDLVGHILQECLAAAPDGEAMIALRGEQRWLPAYEPVPFSAASASAAPVPWLQPRQTYLITGGLGRIGMVLAQHLADLPCNLVLTTRATFPARAQWESLAEAADTPQVLQHTLKQFLRWETLGTRVLVLQADLINANDVERILTMSADRFAGLHGIFHAAGQAHLRYLTELTRDDSAQEFAPKIQGLSHLEKAIGQLSCKPAFVVLFSSMASILGGLAMTAYVAANRFMDAFVQANPRRHGVSWLSINWDDWDFAYTKEQVRAYEHTQARFAMTTAEGLEALRRILAYGQPLQLLVATRPLPARLAQWARQRADVEDAAGRQHGARNDMAVSELVETSRGDGAATGLVQRVAAVYREVLGLEAIDAAANFFDLGGDSLLAAQILLQLRRQLPQAHHLQLPAVFEYPTVREMARYILTTEVDAGDHDRSSETL